MPEILWKNYIDFEMEQDEVDKARELYRRLLEKTQHVKVWMSHAQFELQVPHQDNVAQVRNMNNDNNNQVCICRIFFCTNFVQI